MNADSLISVKNLKKHYMNGSIKALDDVSKELGIEFEDCDYDTFGGYIIGILGTIPDDGTKMDLETEFLNIKITHIDEHRIEKTIVSKKLIEENEEE